MQLPRRNFYYTDLFAPDLYERIWTDTLYVTQTFVYRLFHMWKYVLIISFYKDNQQVDSRQLICALPLSTKMFM